MKESVKGKCLCGQVELKFIVEKKEFSVCHCSMCRQWGGGPLMTVDIDSGFEVLAGDASIGRYNSSEWAERHFCKNCGTHLMYRLKEGGHSNVALGILENSQDYKFSLQIYTDSKPHNYDFANQTKTMTEAEVMAMFAPSV